MKAKKQKKVIGRIEIVDFPELDISEIQAKVDTGAYTSSIHCTDVRLEERDGEQVLCFKIFTEGETEESLKDRCFKSFKQKKIKSSIGKKEKRFIIKTKIRLFDKEYPVELSLADRAKMRYPVLLGRKVLYKRFIVDVSKKNLSKNSL